MNRERRARAEYERQLTAIVAGHWRALAQQSIAARVHEERRAKRTVIGAWRAFVEGKKRSRRAAALARVHRENTLGSAAIRAMRDAAEWKSRKPGLVVRALSHSTEASLALCFGRWKTETFDLASAAFKKWAAGALTTALQAWRDWSKKAAVTRQKSIEAFRWRAARIERKALLAMAEHTRKRAASRRQTETALRFWRMRMIVGGFGSWKSWMEYEAPKSLVALSRKAGEVKRSFPLKACFSWWRAAASRAIEAKGRMAIAEGHRMSNLFRAVTSAWAAVAASHAHRRRAIATAIASGRIRSLRSALAAWRQRASELAKQRSRIGAATDLRRTEVLTAAIRAWQKWSRNEHEGRAVQAHRKRSLCGKALGSWIAVKQVGKKKKEAFERARSVVAGAAARHYLCAWRDASRESADWSRAIKFRTDAVLSRVIRNWQEVCRQVQAREFERASRTAAIKDASNRRILVSWKLVASLLASQRHRAIEGSEAIHHRNCQVILRRCLERWRAQQAKAAHNKEMASAARTHYMQTVTRKAANSWRLAVRAEMQSAEQKIDTVLAIRGLRILREALRGWTEAAPEQRKRRAKKKVALVHWSLAMLRRHWESWRKVPREDVQPSSSLPQRSFAVVPLDFEDRERLYVPKPRQAPRRPAIMFSNRPRQLVFEPQRAPRRGPAEIEEMVTELEGIAKSIRELREAMKVLSDGSSARVALLAEVEMCVARKRQLGKEIEEALKHVI